MTSPAPKTLEREKDKLLLTDAELIRWLGMPETPATRLILKGLEEKNGFPRKQKIWGDRRYKPAVKAWLDATHGLKMGASLVGRSDNDR